MINRCFYLLTTLFVLVITSCKKPNESNNKHPQLTTTTSSLTLGGEIGSVDSFIIQSSVSWTIAITPSTVTWMKASITNGKGDMKVLITAQENNYDADAKTATITITPEGNSSLQPVTIAVRQKSAIPHSLWTKIYGGTSYEQPEVLIETADKGFVMAGLSMSNEGDFSGNHGEGDGWVIKLDANGNKQWSKLFGGTSFDNIYSAVATPDGGYVLAGQTSSNDGDGSGNKGGSDVMVIKLDAIGNKQWSKVFGGTSNDYVYSIKATDDGGFMLAGVTQSKDGDVSGTRGGFDDAWILKLDANGNKQWSKLFGGTGQDTFKSIIITTDGGYILAGFSNSTDGDVNGNHGSVDAWVVKIDGNGNKQWSKTFGGSSDDMPNSIITTTDGGYVFAGYSRSNDGLFNSNHGFVDAWVMKLDASGNIQWNKLFGGDQEDVATSVIAIASEGYIIAGSTGNNNSDFGSNRGGADAWLMKIDNNGNKKWVEMFGGSRNDYTRVIIKTTDGGFVLDGMTESNDGDFSGNHGLLDAWVVKLKPE